MPEWNNNYAAALRHFLSQEAGRVFIEILNDKKPKINSESIERSALSAHAVLGYDQALQEIDDMANFQEAKASTGPNFVRS